MPNHFHGIIKPVGVPLVGTQNVEQPQTMAQQTIGQSQQIGQPQGIAPTVGDVVGAFKSLTTNHYIWNVKRNNWHPFNKKLWQRNYFEHIIRNHESYLKITEYIHANPFKWREDKNYISDFDKKVKRITGKKDDH
jgi:putative transposase